MATGASTVCIETGGQKAVENRWPLAGLDMFLFTNHIIALYYFLFFLKPSSNMHVRLSWIE